ncbi:MAG: NADPH-dependent glutamate synthase [Clostridia bacterium]|nr:NADPH-dependent glutamate synthase [Clostridia bacterium]
MNDERKNPVVRDASVRSRDFEEVCLGFDAETAKAEAARCLNCKNAPCRKGCPVGVNIPLFISLVKRGDNAGAKRAILADSNLPSICGRVCPQESQCEKLCVRGIKGEPIAIGQLERFAADNARIPLEKAPPSGRRVAVVGSGPAGLTCAGDLAKAGVEVTVYEAFHKPGGVLVYGIPEFRLPKELVKREISSLEGLGVKFVTDAVVGKTLGVEELYESYDAVFIGTGAGLPMFMGIPGENLNGVFSANEYLTRVNLMKAYLDSSDTPVYRAKKAVVVGAGNVAMDAARTALRMGAEVTVVYRRSRAEMPARAEEIVHAGEEGITFRLLSNPVRINGENGFVKSVTCVEMELGEPDASGRRSPVVKENSEFTLECDMLVMALGTSPNPLLTSSFKKLELGRKGVIVASEETAETSVKGIYAGGDAVTGSATVIKAMGQGKLAARSILKSFENA